MGNEIKTVGELKEALSYMNDDMPLSLNLNGEYDLKITSVDNLYKVSGGDVYMCEIYFEI